MPEAALPTPPDPPSSRTLVVLMGCVFSVFLVTGAALPALPLYIHGKLGFSAFTVGVVSGAQFTASLLCRLWAGALSDRRGPKFAVIGGLGLAALAGLLYILSAATSDKRMVSIVILLLGRILLGGAESAIMIGAQSWCLALAGYGQVGKMLAWIGTAMFIAMAAGAPLGSFLFAYAGFASIGWATLLGAAATWLMVAAIPAIPPSPHHRKTVGGHVLRAVWLPGLAIAFSSLGYGIMTAFAVLLFVQKGWQPAWLSFSAFALALMLARVFFGSVPDRLGGARTAMIFIVIHSAGLALIWCAPNAGVAFVGAAMAGFGYALVFPGLGMEAVARSPADAKGRAMGVYTAFIDLALGLLAPLLGLAANAIGLAQIFLITALLALCAVPIVAWLLTHPPLALRSTAQNA